MKWFVIIATLLACVALYYAYKEARRVGRARASQALVLRYSIDPTIGLPNIRGTGGVAKWIAHQFDRSRFQSWLSSILELAEVKIEPRRAAIYTIVGNVVLVSAFNLWLGSLVQAQFWAAVFIIGGTAQFINFKQSHRRRAFEKALPDFLLMLASSLRAGLSLQRGIEAVSSEGDGEVERQLRRVSTEIAMGVQPDEALSNVATRMRSQDMNWVVVAIGIQRRVGGNLSAILDLVADTVRGREAIRQEVRAVSSEGRMSANVLVALPVGVFLLLLFTRRDYVSVLWLDPTGRALMFTTISLIVTGLVWVRNMVNME